MYNLASFVGRVLLAALFIFDATVLARSWDGSLGFVGSLGLPAQVPTSAWLTAVIACEFLGGILIVIGLWTRLVALAFALFCVGTAIRFHYDLASTDATVQAGKDLAIAGGFLLLSFNGPGGWSFDARRRGM